MSDSSQPRFPGKAGLLHDFQQVADDLGHPPTTREYDAHGHHTHGAFYNHWDEWDEVVTAAGYDPATVPKPGVTKDAFLADLRQVATDIEAVPTMDEYQQHGVYSAQIVYNFFESYREALDEARLDTDEFRKRVSQTELLSELRAGYHALGYAPTVSDMQAFGEYHPQLYRQRFGSWEAALDAADIPLPDSRRYSTNTD